MGAFKKAFVIGLLAFAVNFARKTYFRPKSEVNFGGSVEPGFEEVAKVFKINLENGLEGGAAFSAYYKGEKVVDVWGGYADREAGSPWMEKTLSQLFSVTKSIAAITAAVLVEKGKLKYEEKIAKYWPDFAQGGKSYITVDELLSHQAGLPYIDTQDFSLKEYYQDPDTVSKIFAAQSPLWKPGASRGYHTITWGIYVDELLRRIDKKKRFIGDIAKDEVINKLNLDMYVGLPESEFYRATRNSQWTTLRGSIDALKTPKSTAKWNFNVLWGMIKRDHVFFKSAFTNPTESGIMLDVDGSNRDYLRKYPLSSCQGFSTARSLARLYGILANGGSEGKKKLLSSTSIEKLFESRTSGPDEVVFHWNKTYGAGVMLDEYKDADNKTVVRAGHEGWGGQMAYADLERNTGFAYLTNHWNPIAELGKDVRYTSLRDALYQSIDRIEKGPEEVEEAAAAENKNEEKAEGTTTEANTKEEL